MNCRQFRTRHVAFVDDLLPAHEAHAMRAHAGACERCSRVDIRIRRSLMVVRSLPRIEPSADFALDLDRRLRALRLAPADGPPGRDWRLMSAVGAFVCAALLFISVQMFRTRSPGDASTGVGPQVAASRRSIAPMRIDDAAIVAAMPAGVPIWSAVMTAGQLPARFVSVDFTESPSRR